MFGGDDVIVVPSSFNDNSVCHNNIKGGIEVLVRLSCVVINIHSIYNIYPKDVCDKCDPLLRIYTTTSETIFLQEMRASDMEEKKDDNYLNVEKEAGVQNICENKEELCTILRERITSSSGQRILSIRPLKYMLRNVSLQMGTPS